MVVFLALIRFASYVRFYKDYRHLKSLAFLVFLSYRLPAIQVTGVGPKRSDLVPGRRYDATIIESIGCKELRGKGGEV